jgi:sarcosine oxidase subunit gamma
VADDPLRRRSALAARYREARPGAAPGVTLAERRLPGMVEVAMRGTARTIAGIALPAANRAATTDATTALSLGPGRWLLIGPALGERLHGAEAAVIDQSDARTVIRVAGPETRALLAQGTGIDLASFATGSVAATLLADIAVVLHAGEREAIDVYVPRSYALALWEWLLEAAAPYGCEVAPRQ